MRQQRHRWRRAGAALTAAGALLALGGCAAPGSPDAVELRFWGWAPGLEEVVAEYNAMNDDVHVEFVRMTGDDGAKVPAAIDAGAAPDVVQMSVHELAGHIINGRLTDLAPYADGLEEQFTESSWAGVSYLDGVYAIPQDSGPTGLMYREDLFAEHGVDVPTTWEEYIEAGRELKAADPDLHIGQFSPNETGLWLEQVWQNEGTLADIDGDSWVIDVDGEASLEVADIWQTLIDEELVLVTEMWTPEYWAAVNDGSIASVNYAAWFPPLLEESAASLSGSWRVAPTPTFGDAEAAGDTGGSVNIVPTGTEHVQEAVDFLAWLNADTDSLDVLIEQGGLFPSAVAGLESDQLMEPSEYFGGQVIAEVFADAAATVPGTWMAGPTHATLMDGLSDRFASVAGGGMTIREALEQTQTATVSELQNMGLNVR